MLCLRNAVETGPVGKHVKIKKDGKRNKRKRENECALEYEREKE